MLKQKILATKKQKSKLQKSESFTLFVLSLTVTYLLVMLILLIRYSILFNV